MREPGLMALMVCTGALNMREAQEPCVCWEAIVAREEDFDRSRRPPQHLLEPVRQVDRCRASEGISFGHTIHRSPTTVMHAVPGHDILGYGTIDPPHATAPLRLILIPA